LLFIARGAQGCFAAVLAPATLSLIAVGFEDDDDERARAFGIYGAVSGAGVAVGLVLGGALTEISWRLCLFVNVPLAIVTFIAASAFLSESRATGDTRYDIKGAILGTVGLAALVYGFAEASAPGVGWGGARTIALLCAGVACLVAFVIVEGRTSHPLLPLSVITHSTRAVAFLTSLLLGAGLFALYLFLTYYFQTDLHYSSLHAGLAFLPASVAIIVGAGLATKALERTGPLPSMATGLGVAAVGMLLLLALARESSWIGLIVPAEILIGVGTGLVLVPLSSAALTGVADHDAGVASALLNTTQQIGGALGIGLLNTIYAAAASAFASSHHSGVGSVGAALHGDHVSFAAAAGILTIALVLVGRLLAMRLRASARSPAC
jgi:MFS family permease